MPKLNLYLPSYVRAALAGEMRSAASAGKKKSFSGFLTGKLARLIGEGRADVSLLPPERAAISNASKEYHLSVKVDKALMEKLKAEAEASGLSPSYYATAVLMNHALSISKDARAFHISIFFRGR